MSHVRNSNLLYRPAVSVWTARRLDRGQTEQVNENAGAVSGAARVNKHLLPECKELEAVQKAAAAFRSWVYENTLPWDDSGDRIGQVQRHMDFMAEAGDKMAEFDALVEAFISAYENAKANAQFTLSAMFNAADYPDVGELRSKFRIALEVKPIAASEDFRIVDGLTEEEAERLTAVATANVEARVKTCMDEAYGRLFNVVAKMATTLAQYGGNGVKRFNDSLVNNIADLVTIMPALNIANDPKLSALTQEARQLLDYDLKDLRKDERTRKAAIADAEALVAKFNTIMGQTAQTTVTEQLADVPVVQTKNSMSALFADMLGD